jgi:multimeric flavodoxin WrbA
MVFNSERYKIKKMGAYMRTLIINGSPRMNGDTMTLVNEMVKYLEGEIRIVHTYSERLSPCVDCRYCWENNGCAINDNMQEYYQLLDEVDNVVLASPVYFSELTGELLSFASRLQKFFAARVFKKDKEFKLKEKNGALILAAGGDSRNLEGRAIDSANIIFRHMNAKPVGVVSTLFTNDVPARKDIEALEKAHKLAINLNNLHKELNKM